MDTLSGSVERITFYNPGNGYSVLRLRPERGRPPGMSRDGLVTVNGGLRRVRSVGRVASLAQDRDGFLWIGTGDGLMRFDGRRFVPRGLDPAVPPIRGASSASPTRPAASAPADASTASGRRVIRRAKGLPIRTVDRDRTARSTPGLAGP